MIDWTELVIWLQPERGRLLLVTDDDEALRWLALWRTEGSASGCVVYTNNRPGRVESPSEVDWRGFSPGG